MAYYSTIIQQLARELSRAVNDIEDIKSKIGKVAPLSPPVLDTNEIQKLVDTSIAQKTDALRMESERMRTVIETTITTKLEQYVSKLVKDRVELALSGIRTQVLNDVDLRIEELKEDVLAAVSETSKVRMEAESTEPTPRTTVVPPTAANIEAANIGSSLDIEAMTKDLLAQSETASMAGDSEFNFGTKKKTLRKNK